MNFNFRAKLAILQRLYCLVANFGHFRKAVIFRILAIFWNRFLQRTILVRPDLGEGVDSYTVYNTNERMRAMGSTMGGI